MAIRNCPGCSGFGRIYAPNTSGLCMQCGGSGQVMQSDSAGGASQPAEDAFLAKLVFMGMVALWVYLAAFRGVPGTEALVTAGLVGLGTAALLSISFVRRIVLAILKLVFMVLLVAFAFAVIKAMRDGT